MAATKKATTPAATSTPSETSQDSKTTPEPTDDVPPTHERVMLALLQKIFEHAVEQTKLLTEIRDRLPKPQTSMPVVGTLAPIVQTDPSGSAKGLREAPPGPPEPPLPPKHRPVA